MQAFEWAFVAVLACVCASVASLANDRKGFAFLWAFAAVVAWGYYMSVVPA